MTPIAKLLLTVAFCAATLGAAGLEDLETLRRWTAGEPLPRAGWALGLVVAGAAAMLAVWAIDRARTRASGAAAAGLDARRAEIEELLTRVRTLIHRLTADAKNGGAVGASALERSALLARIDALFSGELFDLTSRHEEVAALLGFEKYARVWDGVAAAERRLARVWSLATDGHLEEALEELPGARQAIERACAEIEKG